MKERIDRQSELEATSYNEGESENNIWPITLLKDKMKQYNNDLKQFEHFENSSILK